jgi:hypothetical protein
MKQPIQHFILKCTLAFVSLLCLIQISFVVLDLTGKEYLSKRLKNFIENIL